MSMRIQGIRNFWRLAVSGMILLGSTNDLAAQSLNSNDVSLLRQKYMDSRLGCRDMSGTVSQITQTPVGQGWGGYTPTEWYRAADLAFAAGCGSTNLDRLRQALDYAESHSIENWWEIEIGVPRSLANGLLRGGSNLPSDLRSRMEYALQGFISRQSLSEWNGANTVWRAWARLAAGFYFNDMTYLQQAVELFASATSQGDYAHIQHDWAYFFHNDVLNMHYGAQHFNDFCDYLRFSEGTSFALNRWPSSFNPGKNGAQLLGEWFHYWIRWITYRGVIDPYTISKLPTMQYGWIDRGAQNLVQTNYAELAPYQNEFQQALNRAPDPIGGRAFPTGRYLVVRRPEFYASLQLLDLVLPHKEASPFAPIFGAVNLVTPQTTDRLDGNNVRNVPSLMLNTMTVPQRYVEDVTVPGSESSNRAHLGEITEMAREWGNYGVSTLESYYGIGGHSLKGPGGSFAFKKSWFFFDEEIVTLTSDLSSTGSAGEIHTWIYAFKPNSAGVMTNAGAKPIPIAQGATENLGRVSWILGDNIGYFFPNGETVAAEGIEENHTRLYLNHGNAPQGAKSAIVLLPNAAQSLVQNYAGLEIIKHDGEAHVVRDRSSGVVGVAFFAGAQSSPVSSNLPGYVLYKANTAGFRFSLHNSHKEASKPIRLEHEGDPINPMVDFDVKPEAATYNDYAVELPLRLRKGGDPSLGLISLRNTGTNRTEISARLRVYRKLEIEGESNSDGSFTLTRATIVLNDAETSDWVIPPSGNPVARHNGPYSGLLGQAILFDGSPSSDPDGNVVSYTWSFGDGATANGVRATHTYNVSGTYQGNLLVSDNDGKQDVAAFEVLVNADGSGNNLVVRLSADDAYELYINGMRVGSDGAWEKSEEFSASLAAGKNVIAIRAFNDAQSVAGLVAEIESEGQFWVSNSAWKVSRTEDPNWYLPNFDDQNWSRATSHGVHGTAKPWSGFTNVAGISTDRGVQWIWSSDNLNHPVVYFRFVVGSDTQAPSAPQGLLVR